MLNDLFTTVELTTNEINEVSARCTLQTDTIQTLNQQLELAENLLGITPSSVTFINPHHIFDLFSQQLVSMEKEITMLAKMIQVMYSTSEALKAVNFQDQLNHLEKELLANGIKIRPYVNKLLTH